MATLVTNQECRSQVTICIFIKVAGMAPSFSAFRIKDVPPGPTDTFHVAHVNVSLRVSHMFSGASLPHCFLFLGIAIFLWAFSGHSGIARALRSTMFSSETGLHCSALLPGLCSHFQSCPEVWGKRGDNASLFIC